MKPRLVVIIALNATLFSGCSHFASNARRAGPPPIPAALAAEFTYPKQTSFAASERVLSTNEDFTVKRFEMPAPPSPFETNKQLVLDCFLPAAKETTPVILVLPILGGWYDLEKHFASYFARQGMAAVIVHREKLKVDASRLDVLNTMLKQTVLDNKMAIDWIETRPEFDAARLGVFGASMGGIKGAMLTPLEPRVQAAVLGLVGGDLPRILTQTTEKSLARRRAAILAEQKLTLPELEKKFREIITFDPNAVAPYVDREKVLLVLAASDTVVPYPTGQELRERMGKPETIVVAAGHYTAVLFLPYIKSQALKFFEKRFASIGKDGKAGIARVETHRRPSGLTRTP